MADEELDKLFSEHKERKQKERINEEVRQSEEQVLRDETIEFMTKTIIPILEKFMKESVDHGHNAQITKRLTVSQTYPNVEFSFKPEQEPLGHISPSIISFIYSGAGIIKIKWEINTATGKSPSGEMSKEVEKVTKQWIETQLKRFIEDVLKAN